MTKTAVGILVLALAAPTAADAADGEALYSSTCASCHGADGSGDTPVGKAMGIPSLVSPKWALDDAEIVSKIKAHVPRASDMSSEDLEAIAGYVRQIASGSE